MYLYLGDEKLPSYIGIISQAFIRIPFSTNQDDSWNVKVGFGSHCSRICVGGCLWCVFSKIPPWNLAILQDLHPTWTFQLLIKRCRKHSIKRNISTHHRAYINSTNNKQRKVTSGVTRCTPASKWSNSKVMGLFTTPSSVSWSASSDNSSLFSILPVLLWMPKGGGSWNNPKIPDV